VLLINLSNRHHPEKQDKIDRDNLLLVMRLEEIMNRKPQTIREKAEQKANPYEEKRERVYKEIENQNLKLVKRLVEISQKSEYDRKKLLAAGEKNQEHVRRLCRYNQPVEK
jgi:hypothetical protein